jgi:hypothetical protein
MVVSAAVLALAASVLYLAAGFGIERRRFFKALEPSAEHARERI